VLDPSTAEHGTLDISDIRDLILERLPLLPPLRWRLAEVPLGPQIPLYCAGARLGANYPVSVITDGMGLNITLMSYLDNIDVGIVADRDQMPDVQKLIGWLQDGVDELLPRASGGEAERAAAQSSTPSSG